MASAELPTNAPAYPPLEDRPLKNTICLFDIDETLTPARNAISPEMLDVLARLRQKCAIGYVSGSNLAKQQEQIGDYARPGGADVRTLFDYCFSENGLTSFKAGAALPSTSFIQMMGEERYKEFVNFCLHYIADLDIPIKRGTFIEFRHGMANVSPLGRNASNDERKAFEEYDRTAGVRKKFVEILREKFGSWGLTFSIGGMISFDVFPTGWDKTYCLKHLEDEAKKPGGIAYTDIHFFGDMTQEGGNDYEIYTDPRTVGHSVANPADTLHQLKEVFDL
jgi:phosphomannomutase